MLLMQYQLSVYGNITRKNCTFMYNLTLQTYHLDVLLWVNSFDGLFFIMIHKILHLYSDERIISLEYDGFTRIHSLRIEGILVKSNERNDFNASTTSTYF